MLVLMCSHASVSCCCVKGRSTCVEGSCADLIVSRTASSCERLNAGSGGRVDTDWKCCAKMLRLATGDVGGCVLAGVWNVGNGVDVDGVVRCHAVQMI